ncbi:MAG: hypothetical protein DHS20C09_20140 [marine bacterium B5-7]|nr:MAG: hypothetical protein DHS20C09_20140 [marine bacterium B5-7]
MANQSKSVLTPFLIIAGLVFTVALAWKFLGNQDDPQTTENQVKAAATEGLEKKEVTLKADNNPKEIKIVSYSKPAAEDELEITPEQKAEIEMKSEYFMKFSMRYSTPKLAIDGLTMLREQGDTDKATALIKYIEEQFPNTEIPEDLLEF